VIVAPQGGGAGARPPVVPVPPVLPAEGAARRRPRPPDWSWADGRASGRPWCWPADGPRPAPLARRASYRRASMAAALAAPYRHARLSAMKLAGDPNNPVRIRDDATLEELRAEMMKHLGILIDGGLIDLEALPAPNRGLANQPNG
jgi:hypothetical protein